MNKLKFAMGALLLPAILTGCQKQSSNDDIIEQPSVEIKDGMLTPEVLAAFGRISEAVPSPDGKTIILTIGYESIEKNASNYEIYAMKSDGSDMKRLTKTASSESNIRWIDNGKKIAFLGKDEETGKPQIFTMNADGSSKKRASKLENGVTCFEFAPDGSKVIMGSLINAEQKDSTIFDGLPETSGRLINDLMYKHWDEWVTEIPHPFLADFNGSEVSSPIDIMENEPFECPIKPFGGAETFAWSPDSRSLIYTSRKLTGLEYAESTDSNLYLYDIEKKTTECLTEGMPGYDTDPMYSPDGSSIAWLSMANAGFESDKKRLMVMDMKTREKRDLTANWDYWPEGMAWEEGGKSIVFHAYYEGTEPVFRIDVNSCKIDTIASGVCDYANVKPMQNGKVLALRSSMLAPKEVVAIENGKITDITNINGDLLSQLKEVKVEKRMVPTTDGKMMTCWVVLPPDFDPNKQYPALLYCQGGPQQAVSQFWSYRWNFRIMAANGYVVIAPNRRGVPGFGEEWNAQISGDYGGQNMQDYLSAAEYIANEPYVNANKVGAVGASYGGFSVYWLAGHNNGHFAAFIAHAGMFNLEAQYLETEEMWFVNHDLGGNFWDKSNAVAQKTYANSPHLFVNNWTAPILVTVGELDYRILASQGMQAFNSAKMHGLDAQMLVFPDENHWIIKPQNAVLWQRVFFNFLDKHLK
jgi:dipeptidyl aminopeptidase/acylaminoacyl peptidase